MKFIGQYIQDLIARFRNDVYLEDISSGTIASGGNLGLDSNNKIVKANEPTSHDAVTLAGTPDYITLSGQEITRNQIDLTADITGTLPVGNGGTGVTSLGSINISSLNNDSGFTANTGDINQVSFTSDSGSFGVTTGDADFTISGGEGIDTSMSLGTITIAGEDASDSNKGIVELATTAEADTGTDTARAVTPAGLKSHVDNRYAYQYLNWEVNTNSFTGTNYELPAANGGFGSDSFTINSGLARDTAIDGTVTMSLASNLQQQGWFVPHACKLVAVSGSFRNNGSESNPRDVAIFVGTPDIGSSNPSTYTQRLFAAGDVDGGAANSKIYKVNTVLGTPFSLSAGDLIMPAVCNSTGSSTVSMQGNFNIIIGTPIFTI